MNLKQQIGLKVRAARLKRSLTQEQLAERVDKTAESISNIERGHVTPPLDTLARIAQELDTPMTFFFEDIGTPRAVARNRLELEHRLRSLGEELTDAELRLSVSIMEAIKTQSGNGDNSP
ncbi:helix-turn-helix domain-containing protein [Paramagnetospirillum magneticum]|nr:helix-turn-helix transcriptional regulator [Paramagnetospirillum magneticum]